MKCVVQVYVYAHPLASTPPPPHFGSKSCIVFLFAGINVHHCKNSGILEVHGGNRLFAILDIKTIFG